MLHQPIQALPATHSALVAAISDLPYREQIEVVREIVNGMSFSRGADMADAGLDRIVNDLDDEQLTVECGLPQDAWAYARMGGR